MTDLSHNALADDLAAFLAGYSTPMCVWTDMQLGPSGSPRPDVYTIEKTYSALRARAYEVKVSRSDFLSDATSGKYLKYLQYAGSVTFATPVGLISKDEVPKGCGLIVRSPDGTWRHLKKPVVSKIDDLPRGAWMKLLIDGIARAREVTERTSISPREYNRWVQHSLWRERAGKELGAAIRNRDDALARLQIETEEIDGRIDKLVAGKRMQLEETERQIRAMIAGAAKELGLPEDCSMWQIGAEIRRRMDVSTGVALRDSVRVLDNAVDGMTRERDALLRIIGDEDGRNG